MSHKMIAEFDGAFIRFNKGLLEIVIVEAKNTRKGASNNAEKELREKLARLHLQDLWSRGRT
jgi:hypothetical protein